MSDAQRRNLFAISFFGGPDTDKDDCHKFVSLALTAWPITFPQLETLFDTCVNWITEHVEVYYRPSSSKLIVHVYDATDHDNCLFHAKIEENGKYG